MSSGLSKNESKKNMKDTKDGYAHSSRLLVLFVDRLKAETAALWAAVGKKGTAVKLQNGVSLSIRYAVDARRGVVSCCWYCSKLCANMHPRKG